MRDSQVPRGPARWGRRMTRADVFLTGSDGHRLQAPSNPELHIRTPRPCEPKDAGLRLRSTERTETEHVQDHPASPEPLRSRHGAHLDRCCGSGAAAGRRAAQAARGRQRARDISATGPGGGDRPALRQRCRQLGRRVARHGAGGTAEEPASPAPGRGAGVRARRDRHAALGRRQGQPVLPARLQPGPRHRLRDLRQRPAGEHAHARARAGLLRPQLPDPGAGGPHRLPQGPVLREHTATSPRRVRPTSCTAPPSTSPSRR